MQPIKNKFNNKKSVTQVSPIKRYNQNCFTSKKRKKLNLGVLKQVSLNTKIKKKLLIEKIINFKVQNNN